jgi:hypothetical protein
MWAGSNHPAFILPSNRFNPLLGCPDCEEPGPLTLLAWPRRTTHLPDHRLAGSLSRRYYLCIYCGYRTYCYGQGDYHRMPGTQGIFGPAEVEQMRHYYEECLMTSGEIAKLMFCFPTTVRKYLHEAGVEMRPKGGSRPHPVSRDLVDQVRRLYQEEQMTVAEVGKELNLRQDQVLRVMVKHSIPRRSRSEGNRIASAKGRNGFQYAHARRQARAEGDAGALPEMSGQEVRS